MIGPPRILLLADVMTDVIVRPEGPLIKGSDRRAAAFNAYVGIAVDVVCFFMALLSFRGISTPSLNAQGEQRRFSLFNIPRDIPHEAADVQQTLHRFKSAGPWT